MRALALRLALPSALALAAAAAACSVHFPEETVYSCSANTDCGPEADGYVCLAQASGRPFCCKPSDEVCDDLDNDCDGKTDDGLVGQECYGGPDGTAGKGICRKGTQDCVDGKPGECLDEIRPTPETCNELDDDCDGQTDEDFDLKSDVSHCGNCQTKCLSGQWCTNGKCTKDLENCADGLDNDRNGKTDCGDSVCLAQSCKASPLAFTCDPLGQCSCDGVVTPTAESACDDHADNDCDGSIDCPDGDCEGKSCGLGCACKALQASETDCANVRDDDQDTKADCADADCDGKTCGAGCACAAGAKTETDCTDGVDNDGDFKRDCVDADCAGKACQAKADAGTVPGTCQSNACVAD